MLVPVLVIGQPKSRRADAKKSSSASSGMTLRAREMFPTAVDMPENVSWRRDIYRELDLSLEANAPLYYPVEPVGKQMNLFTYVFKLALFGYIPVYEYRLDGSEQFNDSSRVDLKTILDNYHIFYEYKNGKLRVDNSDIPSAEVKAYYLKESAYYDESNSTFRRKTIAFCPIMVRDDDFGGEPSKYPLFWVKYSDVASYLSRQTIQASSLNNAASMSLDDYFTLARYDGKIYKTNNLLGQTIAQIGSSDEQRAKEQKKVEDELAAFQKNLYGDQAKKDSLDSIAKLGPKVVKSKKAKTTTAKTTTTKVKKAKVPRNSSSSGSGSARVTVRRERH